MKTTLAAWISCLLLVPTLAIANNPPSGALKAPRGAVSGDLYVAAAAHDADGLNKVTVVFVSGGRPLVLCDDTDLTRPCPATSGQWSVSGVDLANYDVSGSGALHVGLWVEDDQGWKAPVAAEDVTYTTIFGNASGQVLYPAGTITGDVFVRVLGHDSDGITRVEVDFGGSSRLTICDPCSGNDWKSSGADPGAYGATAGPLTTRLYIRDGSGEQMVAHQGFAWQPAAAGASTGDIASPNGSVTGNIFFVAGADESDRLDRVAVQLGSGEVELCGSSEPCLSYGDSWQVGGIDPGSLGAVAGTINLRLDVTDGAANTTQVLYHDFTWQSAAARASSGTINSMTDNGDGTVTANVNVADVDGLHRVTLAFVASGSPYELCDNSKPGKECNGTSRTFPAASIDPRFHGASAGSLTVGLWVQDSTGRKEAVDSYTFTYSPPAAGGVLTVSPGGGTETSGEEGGPFGPLASYTLENTGDATLDFSADVTYSPNAGAWLTVGNAAGSLSPGATTTVSLSVNSVAESFGDGTYAATVQFVNATNGLGDTSRNVTLTVDPATVPPVFIGGTIRDTSGNTIEGVRIDGMPVVHWTDVNGEYGRVVPYGWSGIVSPHKAGVAFTPDSVPYTNVTASMSNEDYIGTTNTKGIIGRVTLGAGVLEGVVMNGLPGPPVTAADGTYTGIVPFGFTGTVTPQKTGYVFTPPSMSYDDLRGWRYDQDYNAAVELVTLSGRITRNGSGLSGVWLAGLPGGVTTDANGDYSASVQRGWSGTVTPQKAGYAFTPSERVYTNVQGGENGDYTAVSLPAGSRRLWLVANDSEMTGATVSASGGDMVLVSPGTYNDVLVSRLDPGTIFLSTGGADVTILTRTGDHRFNQDDVTADGFTFQSTSATEPVQVYGHRVKILNSRFIPPAGEYSLRASSADDLLLAGNVFDRQYGILLRSSDAAGEMVVRNNEFRNVGYGLSGGSNSGLSVRLENNLFSNISRDAVEMNGLQKITITNNIFANVTTDGIDVQDVTQQSSIVHNVFYKNGQAIGACNLSVLVYDNIFQENTKGIDGCVGATVNVHHDLIWGGTWLWGGPSYIQDTSTIWRDTRNPSFVNAAGGDFHLGATSQAKSIASDGTDLGAYGGTLGNSWAPVPGTPQAPPTLVTFRLEGQGELSPGSVVFLKAEADFTDGFYAVLSQKATWTSSNESVLHSAGNGRFEGVAPGTVTVTASWNGNSETMTVTVLNTSIVLSVTDSPDPVLPGGTLQYSVNWRNDGPGTVLGARLVASYDTRTSNPSSSVAPDAATDNTWTLGDLVPGTSGAMTISVDVNGALVEGDVLNLGLAFESSFYSTLPASASTSVEGRGDLAVTKTCVPAQAFPGDEITCTLSWSNNGSGTALGAQVVESYPSGLTFVRGRPAPSSGTALWLLGDVARLATGTVEVDLRVDDTAVGEIVNQVDVLFDEADLNPADDRATLTVAVTPRADLAISLDGAPNPVTAGETLTWTLTATNNGPSVATGLTVEQILPVGTVFESQPTGDGWSCATGSSAVDVTASCTRTALGGGLSSTIQVLVTAPPTAGTFGSTAGIDAVTTDPNASNNTTSHSVTVASALPAAILLVDDDDNTPDVRATYAAALDALGMGYDVWDTGVSDNEPDALTLDPYEVVIWWTGDHTGGFAGPGPVAETALASYLDAGGCLLISSQDYLWDRGVTSLMTSHLGLASGLSDVRQSTVTGAGPFAGRGPYTLAFPYGNFSDRLTPDASAVSAWTGNAGNAAVSKETNVYGTTFWGFGLEAIPTSTAREDVLADALAFCSGVGVLFADGFESGGFGAWSSWVP